MGDTTIRAPAHGNSSRPGATAAQRPVCAAGAAAAAGGAREGAAPAKGGG